MAAGAASLLGVAVVLADVLAASPPVLVAAALVAGSITAAPVFAPAAPVAALDPAPAPVRVATSVAAAFLAWNASTAADTLGVGVGDEAAWVDGGRIPLLLAATVAASGPAAVGAPGAAVGGVGGGADGRASFSQQSARASASC